MAPCVHTRLEHISSHAPNDLPCCDPCPGCHKQIMYGEMNNHLRTCHTVGSSPAEAEAIAFKLLMFPGVDPIH